MFFGLAYPLFDLFVGACTLLGIWATIKIFIRFALIWILFRVLLWIVFAAGICLVIGLRG